MNCPNCTKEMDAMTVHAHLGASVTIDVCMPCQAFWFDKFESLQLSPGATLQLMKVIGEHSSPDKPFQSGVLRCPRCSTPLLPTHDFQRNTRFRYSRCDEHGRFISFYDFLREKDFIRPLSTQQIEELRKNIQIVNCSNCGAPIDLETDSECTHCGSPLSMLDMKQPQELLAQLKEAAEPRPIDPALPFELELAKRRVEHWFGPSESSHEWWSDASSGGLVQAGLNAVIRGLTKLGL